MKPWYIVFEAKFSCNSDGLNHAFKLEMLNVSFSYARLKANFKIP